MKYVKRFLWSVIVVFLLATPSVFSEGKKEKTEGPGLQPVDRGKYGEAPMLAALVDKGELPVVEERLPKEPVVVEPWNETPMDFDPDLVRAHVLGEKTKYRGEIGKYGGTLRGWTTKPGLTFIAPIYFKYQRLIRFMPDRSFSGLLPDIAKDYEASDDRRTFTFYLREGLKWSDGHPFTSEDVAFYWNDVMNNDELSPQLGLERFRGNINVVDDYTFRVEFEKPYGLFMQAQANLWRLFWHQMPKHYLSQFHPDYVSDSVLQERIEEAGADSWSLLFSMKFDYYRNPDLPVLSMFKIETPPDETGFHVFSRNPYYYKVDSDGNQLPYIDKLQFVVNQSMEVGATYAIAGDLDVISTQMRANNYPLLKQNEATSPIYVGPNKNDKGGEMVLFLNQTVNDPVLREVFGDVRFRRAVSLAMNREELVDTVFAGAAVPRQASHPPGTPVFDPEWPKLYADYDPDRARELLDDMGLNERDSDGFRLGPDGETLTLLFDWSLLRTGWENAYQLVVEYLNDVGIKAVSNALETDAMIQRMENNEVQMSTYSVPFGLTEVNYMLPEPGSFPWGIEWGRWILSDGKSGEEPPRDVKQLAEYYEQAESAMSAKERIDTIKKATQILKDKLYYIGIFGMDNRPIVVHDRLRNVQKLGMPMASWLVPIISASHNPEQFWIDPTVSK